MFNNSDTLKKTLTKIATFVVVIIVLMAAGYGVLFFFVEAPK